MAQKKGLLGPQKAIVKKQTNGTNAHSADPKGKSTGPSNVKPKSALAKGAKSPGSHVPAAAGKSTHKQQPAQVQSGVTKPKKAGTLFSSGPVIRSARTDEKVYSRVAHPTQGHTASAGGKVKHGGVQKKSAKRKHKPAKTAAQQAAEMQKLLPELTKPAAVAEVEQKLTQAAGGSGAGVSNWERMKALVASSDAALKLQREAAAGEGEAAAPKRRKFDRQRKQKRDAAALAREVEQATQARDGVRGGRLVAKSDDASSTKVLAMDCEMVGVGIEAKRSALARVCVINDHGNVLLDLFVRPKEKVTDYRTKWSGIRPADLQDAVSLEDAMQQVHDVLKGHVLVGHALHNDFKVLMLEGVVPHHNIRDTSVYEPLMSATAAGRKMRSRGLKVITQEELGVDIQAGEHSPVDDSRAALYIYHKHKTVWEAGLRSGVIKTKSLKNAAKIAVGAKRMKAPRASEVSAQPLPSAVVDDDDEYARPSREAVIRMQARMNDTAQDIYADL